MSEQPDYTQAGEVFKKSMQEALAHLDQLSAEVTAARDKAIDRELAAKEELHRIQLEAEKLSQAFIDQHRKEYDSRVRRDTLMEVIEKLILVGRSSGEIKLWLEVDEDMIVHAHTYLKFERLGDRMANVFYDNQGRAGYVILIWDGLVLKFPYEFGGGNTLATIDVPEVKDWEIKTTIPVSQRNMVLEFLAKRILKDQAPDHLYTITADQIQILSGSVS
jgi:hypothetical protein